MHIVVGQLDRHLHNISSYTHFFRHGQHSDKKWSKIQITLACMGVVPHI